MASVWITEFSNMGKDAGAHAMPIPSASAGFVVQTAQDPATTKDSAAFASDTKFICVYSDGSFFWKPYDGTAATVSNGMPWAANVPLWLSVRGGDQISFIAG